MIAASRPLRLGATGDVPAPPRVPSERHGRLAHGDIRGRIR